jgi:hypothetical protein
MGNSEDGKARIEFGEWINLFPIPGNLIPLKCQAVRFIIELLDA